MTHFQISKRLGEEYNKKLFNAHCFFSLLSLFLLFISFILFFFLFLFINDLLRQIKTVELNMYAEDGQLHTSNYDLVSLERRISLVVSSANAWYENDGIIANRSKHQGMLLGNTEHHFHSSRLSKDLGLRIEKESARMALNFEWRVQILLRHENEADFKTIVLNAFFIYCIKNYYILQ